MYALWYEVKSRDLSADIDDLILVAELAKKSTGEFDFSTVDLRLKDNAGGSDQFAE